MIYYSLNGFFSFPDNRVMNNHLASQRGTQYAIVMPNSGNYMLREGKYQIVV